MNVNFVNHFIRLGGQRVIYKQITAQTKFVCAGVFVWCHWDARNTLCGSGGRRRQLRVPNPCLVLGRNNDSCLKTIMRLSFGTELY